MLSSCKIRKNIEDPLPGFMIRNKYKRSLFIYLFLSCKMVTFCDVLHEAKQKCKQTLESAQYRLEISLSGISSWVRWGIEIPRCRFFLD